MQIDIDLKFIAVGTALFIISMIYDKVVSKLERGGYPLSLAPILVVVGVFYTLTMAALVVGWSQAVATGILFIFSGAPMLHGGLSRYWKTRETEERTIEHLARRANGREGA